MIKIQIAEINQTVSRDHSSNVEDDFNETLKNKIGI